MVMAKLNLSEFRHHRMKIWIKVHWYGSEATAKNERLLKHYKAIEFANKTQFIRPNVCLE